jgi:uncharacterized membrane protein YkoI
MLSIIRRTAVTAGVIGIAGFGGATIADAASNKTATSTTKPAHSQIALSSDVAAKVKAAALAKVPGATVLRTEAGGSNGAAYHAHIKTSSGTLQTVLVNSSFEATDVVADSGRGGKGHGGRGGGSGETALTGDTKTKVEAAVVGKYPGATIVRSETNNDSTAPYEAHIKTTDGKQLEVLVSSDFTVVEARERSAKG